MEGNGATLVFIIGNKRYSVVEERTGNSSRYPGHSLFLAGAGRNGLPDPDGFNKHNTDRGLPKSDRSTGHILNNISGHREVGQATKLPDWYHYGVIAAISIGIIILLIVEIVRG